MATATTTTSLGSSLHVAGQGATYRTAISTKPTYATHVDASVIETFGASAPVVRYGPLKYSDQTFDLPVLQLASLQALQAVLAQAQAGSTLYYRDSAGTQFTCGLAPSRRLSAISWLLSTASLQLVQVPNTYAASLTMGSALGIPALVYGSVPPLDSSETPL